MWGGGGWGGGGGGGGGGPALGVLPGGLSGVRGGPVHCGFSSYAGLALASCVQDSTFLMLVGERRQKSIN